MYVSPPRHTEARIKSFDMLDFSRAFFTSPPFHADLAWKRNHSRFYTNVSYGNEVVFL